MRPGLQRALASLATAVSASLAALPGAYAQPLPERRPALHRAPLPTSDGVRATLYRYAPALDGPAPSAILLLPDVGMTRHAFDFDRRGLAPYLQEAGWEVFVVEWRGAGRSDVPFGGYRLEDLLDRDAEAAFARALGSRVRIAVGGVGLGATFALALAARHPDRVFAVLAMQPLIAPDFPNEPVARHLAAIERAPPWLQLELLAREPLFGKRSWFEVLLANDGAFSADELASLRLHVLAPVPRAAAAQLASFFRERRLVLGGREPAELFRGWSGPTLLVLATRDNWIHPEQAVPLRELLPAAKCRALVLDVPNGARRDHGHLGMLLSHDAPRDVFAGARRFLEGSLAP